MVEKERVQRRSEDVGERHETGLEVEMRDSRVGRMFEMQLRLLYHNQGRAPEDLGSIKGRNAQSGKSVGSGEPMHVDL